MLVQLELWPILVVQFNIAVVAAVWQAPREWRLRHWRVSGAELHTHTAHRRHSCASASRECLDVAG